MIFFSFYIHFFNDVLLIERGKSAYLHQCLWYQGLIIPKGKSHKITRELLWLLKKTIANKLVCFIWFQFMNSEFVQPELDSRYI